MMLHRKLVGLVCVAAGSAFGQPEAGEAESAARGASASLDRGGALLSDQSVTNPGGGEREPGFLTGQVGFEHFYMPIGNPIYFESPINDTRVTPIFIYHTFPKGSQIAGGELVVYAVQARLAITERLGFIATKDGYSFFNSGAFPDDEGWNDLAAGLKYVLLQDREADAVVSAGLRYMFESGTDGILQGNTQELSPFVSAAKGFDDLQLMANVTWRAPLDKDRGNHILQWSGQASYEVVDGFAPVVGIHGLHYLTDGEGPALSVGGVDYANLGSQFVSGSTVIWADAGAAIRFTPNVELGVNYGFALTNPDADIFHTRWTALLQLRY